MGRVFAVVATLVALLLPVVVGYALRPTPEQNDHALMWLSSMVLALIVSGLLSAVALGVGYSSFQDLPAPRPWQRKAELAFLALPPALFVSVMIWRVLTAGT